LLPRYKALANAELELMDERRHKIAVLRIVNTSGVKGSADSLILLDTKEAERWGEKQLQLLEGRIYEYELTGHPPGSRLRSGVFRVSQLSDRLVERGSIFTGSNTGLLPVILESESGKKIAYAELEIRSSKLQYREQYRVMLDYIAAKATDLLMEIRAPAMVRLAPEPSRDATTVAQQFAFLRAVLGTPEFFDALDRILSIPHTTTIRDEREQDVRRGIRASASAIRQLTAGQPRTKILPEHPIAARLSSVPLKLRTTFLRHSIDTPENRFIKYVLSQFATFLTAMEKPLTKKSRAEDRQLFDDILRLKLKLEESLSHAVFSSVSAATSLPLGSPVLQRKGGYREVLQAWLSFNLAARLTWEGGNDVYASGKKNVAALYEYWLFFRLVDLFGKKFNFRKSSRLTFMEKTSEGFGLKLKSGRHLPIVGEFNEFGRRLAVKFSYNRTFVRRAPVSVDVSYPSAGSWTRNMRPDYTLSIWPSDFTEDAAEVSELMVHLHFDAKYRIDNLNEIFGNDADEESEENDAVLIQNRSSKRDDLLKMHAYRDAIRRTSGAYVLYPGTEVSQWREYHELLPSLGAFAIRPDLKNDGTTALSMFIDDVMKHLCDRASKQERQSYHINILQSSPHSNPVHVNFPERAAEGKRVRPITEQFVLAVWCGDGGIPISGHTAYIQIPFGIGLDENFVAVKYILVYNENLSALPGLIEVVSGPRLVGSKDVFKGQITSLNAALPIDRLYLAYDLGEEIITERRWSPGELELLGVKDKPALPAFLRIEDLFSSGSASTG